MDNNDKKTVLIVDDMTTILEHAKVILKDDYKLIPCTGGRQALDIISKRKPDVILLDVNMPEMEGFEVLQEVKRMPEMQDVPVIMITTEITNDIEAKGFELGASDFIIKPFSQVVMLKRIAMQLELAAGK